MLRRPHSFAEIKGHSVITEFFIDHIKNGTLPQHLLLHGEEGLGKTSYADLIAINIVYGLEDSEAKNKAIVDVIENNHSNDCIKKFKMSVEGGKDAAKNVLAEFNTSMTPNGRKVIILDECHEMSEAAQDVFLSDTEYFPQGLYMIMLTTETFKIKQTLQSRFFSLKLRRLKLSDMMHILKEEVACRQLELQGGDSTLSLICEWAECKPRRALNLLDGFADGSKVSATTIKEFIGYMNVDDVLPVIQCIGGSISEGLRIISDLDVSDSFLDISLEILKIKNGNRSYKLQIEESRKVMTALENVSKESLLRFVYILSSEAMSKRLLIHAFIAAQDMPKYTREEALSQELVQKSEVKLAEVSDVRRTAPTFDDLIRSGDIYG